MHANEDRYAVHADLNAELAARKHGAAKKRNPADASTTTLEALEALCLDEGGGAPDGSTPPPNVFSVCTTATAAEYCNSTPRTAIRAAAARMQDARRPINAACARASCGATTRHIPTTRAARARASAFSAGGGSSSPPPATAARSSCAPKGRRRHSFR